MFDFTHILNKDGSEYVRALCSGQPNPKYYLCSRFFTDREPYYKNFIIQPFKEIITVDAALNQPIEYLGGGIGEPRELTDDQQILCVFCLLDEFGGEIDAPDIAQREIPGFEFCGFDLADEWVSALTNCQGGFDQAFSYKDLNEFGIISDYAKAKSIQKKLYDEYDDEHADCMLFAVFRKINQYYYLA